MVVELKEPLLVQQVTQLARTQKRPPEDVLETAVRDYLETLEEGAMEKCHHGEVKVAKYSHC